jgi:hypothetical protein
VATSARARPASQAARQRPPGTSSLRAATSGPPAPTVANPSATETAGPSTPSPPTAASPCRTSTDTASRP